MTDAWRWSPDLPEDPYPKYADARFDPSVRADVPFQETDDPEGAVAWLDQELERNDQAMAGVTRLNVVIPPERRDLMAETVWVRDDAVASGSCSSCRHAAERGPSGAWWHTISACSDMSASFTLDPPRYPGAPWPVDPEMTPDQVRRIQSLPDGWVTVDFGSEWATSSEASMPVLPEDLTWVATQPEDTDWIPYQQGGWISGSCRFR